MIYSLIAINFILWICVWVLFYKVNAMRTELNFHHEFILKFVSFMTHINNSNEITDGRIKNLVDSQLELFKLFKGEKK